MKYREDPVRSKKIKLAVLMCLIALLTLATDGEDCCPNEEDGLPKPQVITMQVNVAPASQEVEWGESGQVTVSTQCSLPCPPIRSWNVIEGYPLEKIDSQPSPAFRFRASGPLPRHSLRTSNYDPQRNRLILPTYINFDPVLDSDYEDLTRFNRGAASVSVYVAPDEPEVVSSINEEGKMSLGATQIDLGSVAVGNTRVRSLVARNIGLTPVTITGVELSNPGMIDSRESFSISPSQISLTLTPGVGLPVNVSFSPKRAGRMVVELVVKTDDWRNEGRITIVGTGG